MPEVDGKKYPYTAEGIAAAEKAKKSSTFTMKYQGNHSAFPFGSNQEGEGKEGEGDEKKPSVKGEIVGGLVQGVKNAIKSDPVADYFARK